jgi:1-acyl-sn-glycerol-3-phosphate acyltransferase
LLHTVYFSVLMALTLILSLLLLIPYYILLALGLKKARMAFLQKSGAIWGRILLRVGLFSKVTVKGLENLPEGNVLLVSNHQSLLDILTILAYIPKHIGFIAKSDLGLIPIMNFWMKALHCVFIVRKSLKKSAQAIDLGVSYLKDGYSLVIFPEGTRSKSHQIGNFKPGSLKLGTRSGVPIVPVTVDGTYHMFEEHKKAHPAHVRLTVHPPVYPDKLTDREKDALSEKIKAQIMTAL